MHSLMRARMELWTHTNHKVIAENLMAPDKGSRWCLQPITPLVLLLAPRRNWTDIMKPSAVSETHHLTLKRAEFFQARGHAGRVWRRFSKRAEKAV